MCITENTEFVKPKGGGRGGRRGGEERNRRRADPEGRQHEPTRKPTAADREGRGEAPGKHGWRDAGAAYADTIGRRADGERMKEHPLQRSTTRKALKDIMQKLLH